MLCGEGSHDIGQKEWLPGEREYLFQDGWLQRILCKLIDNAEFFPRRRNEIVLLPRDRVRHRPLPSGHGAKALAAKIIAQSSGYNFVVFMADADSNDRREWTRKRNEILAGLNRIYGTPGIACVPMSASESWLTSDENAWSNLGLTDLTLLPTHPETIWGRRDDPDGNHPHRLFARLCNQLQVPDSREVRVSVAEASALRHIEEKCPISFRAFTNDFDAMKSRYTDNDVLPDGGNS